MLQSSSNLPLTTTPSTTTSTPAKVVQEASSGADEEDDVKSDFDDVNYDDYEDETEPPNLTPPKSSGTVRFQQEMDPLFTDDTFSAVQFTSKATTKATPRTSTTLTTTTEAYVPEPANNPPIVRARLQSIVLFAGKTFHQHLSAETFYDQEDGENLKWELLDRHDRPASESFPWLRFAPDTHIIHGL